MVVHPSRYKLGMYEKAGCVNYFIRFQLRNVGKVSCLGISQPASSCWITNFKLLLLLTENLM